MNFLDTIFARARAADKHIVLPEGKDPRTWEAACAARDAGIARITVLGDPESLLLKTVDTSGISIINPVSTPLAADLASELYNLRKTKGLTLEQAQELVTNELYFGVMLVKTGQADGMVAGAANATGDVLRPALQILKTAPDTKLVSSFFIIVVPNCDYGKDGVFLFADCGLVEDPDAEALSEIALSSAESFAALVGSHPQVAMLSYSTHGSAHSPQTEKVIEATRLAQAKRPNLALDGELQLDAAIVASVGASKAPASAIAGKANVLIFPDLNSGNIAYKLAQRLAKAQAFGPITQGIAAPVNDLSRGCSVDDMVGVIAITAAQCQ